MDSANEIEQHIEDERAALERNIQDLQSRLRQVFSWRGQFQERPAAMIGGAFAAGLAISLALVSRSDRRVR